MDSLDDHYGIIDHNRNGKNQCTKSQQVQTKSHQIQGKERTDQRHRNSDSGNQRRTEILQEDIHYKEHQNKGFDKGLDYLVNRSKQEVVSIQSRFDFHSGGKVFLYIFQQICNIADNCSGIGSGSLIDHRTYRIMPVLEVFKPIGQPT